MKRLKHYSDIKFVKSTQLDVYLDMRGFDEERVVCEMRKEENAQYSWKEAS